MIGLIIEKQKIIFTINDDQYGKVFDTLYDDDLLQLTKMYKSYADEFQRITGVKKNIIS